MELVRFTISCRVQLLTSVHHSAHMVLVTQSSPYFSTFVGYMCLSCILGLKFSFLLSHIHVSLISYCGSCRGGIMTPGLYAALLRLNIETPSYFTVQDTSLLKLPAAVSQWAAYL
jgi:hypothetical protein